MKYNFREIVMDSRTGLNPRQNFTLGNGENYYITIKDIHDGKVHITEKTDRIDDTAISIIKRRSRIKNGDILFTSIGRIGETAIVTNKDDSWDVNESVFVFTLNTNIIIPEYFCLLCQSDTIQERLLRDSSGSTFKSIKMNQLEKMDFLIPEIGIQKKVSQMLKNVSDLIALRKQQLAKLDELVKSRFVELFGDIIRNDKGWHQRIFSEIATSRLGKMLDAKQQTGKNSYPYLANFNVQWFRFELKSLNQMDFDEDDQIEFALQDGDLLVCEGGEIGRCAVWHNEIQPCFFQKALHRVRCDRSTILPDYLAWWFKYNCEHGGFSAIEGAKATIAHLPGAKLKNLIVAVPPVSVQEEFVTFVAQTDKSKLEIQAALTKLQTLKKALMQQYFG